MIDREIDLRIAAALELRAKHCDAKSFEATAKLDRAVAAELRAAFFPGSRDLLDRMREVYDALERHGYAKPQACTIDTIKEEVDAGRAAAGRAAEAQMELAELRTRVAALERVEASAGLVLEAWKHDRVASEMDCQMDALAAAMGRGK